jgi:NAD(P)-dependent dehydrogenase (short-subunit alcohol dehydrogenase family)
VREDIARLSNIPVPRPIQQSRTIKRLQMPDDLMGTLVFLASPDSDFMTGRRLSWTEEAYFTNPEGC